MGSGANADAAATLSANACLNLRKQSRTLIFPGSHAKKCARADTHARSRSACASEQASEQASERERARAKAWESVFSSIPFNTYTIMEFDRNSKRAQ